MTNWLNLAKEKIPELSKPTTVITTKRNLTTVLTVPNPRTLEIFNVSNDSIDGASFGVFNENNTEKKRLHRAHLIDLIKQVSEAYGGDEPGGLQEYTDDVLKNWDHNLEHALACFEDVLTTAPTNR